MEIHEKTTKRIIIEMDETEAQLLCGIFGAAPSEVSKIVDHIFSPDEICEMYRPPGKESWYDQISGKINRRYQ